MIIIMRRYIRIIRISLLEIMHIDKYLPEGISKDLSMGHLPTTLSRVYLKSQLNIERTRDSQWVNCNANSLDNSEYLSKNIPFR